MNNLLWLFGLLLIRGPQLKNLILYKVNTHNISCVAGNVKSCCGRVTTQYEKLADFITATITDPIIQVLNRRTVTKSTEFEGF